MFRLDKLKTHEELDSLKMDYLKTVTAPLDGMWESGFIPMSQHWEIHKAEDRVGYFCVDEAGCMLQFHVADEHLAEAGNILQEVVAKGIATTAAVGTNEPLYLSLCLDRQQGVSVSTLLYSDSGSSANSLQEDTQDFRFRQANRHELKAAVAFVVGNIDCDELWLRTYLTERLAKQELYFFCRGAKIIASGECRFSATQPGYADLGVIVSKTERGHGLATQMLARLKEVARQNDCRAICSTTTDNVAAQKAIGRAGFVAKHRILNVTF